MAVGNWQFTGMFKCINIEVEDKIKKPHHRVTVDTPEDFEVVTKIFESLGSDFNVYDICEFLDNNPEVAKINNHIETRKPNKISWKSK